MPDEKPSYGRVLATIRIALDLSQKEAALLWRCDVKQPSSWETEKTVLSREKLIELLEPLELPPEAVEDAEEFRLKLAARRAAFTHPVAGKPSLREQIESISAAAGREAGAFTRRWLTLLLVGGDTLDAERSAVEQWDRLRRHDAEQQRLLIESGGEFCNWALAVLIAEESVVAAADSPRRCRELAELAHFIAERVPGGEGRRRRVMGYIGPYVANSWRVNGDLKTADLALTRADNDWNAGDPWGLDALQETRRLDLASSLRRDQRRLEEALALLDSALATGPRGTVKARLLIQKAKVLEELSEPEASLVLLEMAAPLIDSSRPSILLWTHRFNLAVNLAGTGRIDEAEALLPGVKALGAVLDNSMGLLRLRWLEARILRARGAHSEAAAVFREVCAAFTELGIVYDAALVVFELAQLFAEQGAARQVREVTPGLVALFEAEGVPREAAASFRLFLDAVEKDQLSAAAIQAASEEFQRIWQPQPAAPLEP